MSEQQIHQPGKHEAAGLVSMNEIERPTTPVTRHVVVHRDKIGAYVAHAWNRQTSGWDRERGLVEGAIRAHALAFLVPLVPFANVAITDRCVDYEELRGFSLAEFDDCAFYPDRTVLCPEGVPNMPDEWVSVGFGRSPASISAPCRFAKVSLASRFQNVAFHQPGTREAPTVLVRHDVAARDLVSKERWGITGRPDLMGRMVDDELRRRQQDEEATQRLIQQPGGLDVHRRQQRVARQKATDRAGTGH
ncbi:hypothetical protein FV232_19795 [Methylobacterium sp. WL30]|uniref:hypothetical protein n=1 Tax=unclassified Methylobacterium TaxID=2615210 RepID=UPI0011C83AF2|nr:MULTISPECIES: hypothetical protein [unclassified Methylobacterium]TXN41410.1 hypothetical protein FV225_02670 [Methylobacterium sp. WL93]TXN49792.1 hypothetical protein FV227_14960 [Methylobacterium sp. WL119]TXN64869.1 hypothetical protein FV232_19795 [Methylobacterium sp. WL30]